MYLLKISTNLGISYSVERGHTDLEALKQNALELEKKRDCRWVIVDYQEDMPIYWCHYIEANLRIPKDTTILTDDPYMQKLANKFGFKLMDCNSLIDQLFADPTERAKIKKEVNDLDIDLNPAQVKNAIDKLKELEKSGVVEVISPNFEEDKIGKELFGEKNNDD